MGKIDVPQITNSKIIKVREMTTAERKKEYWDNTTIVLELDNGVKLFASCDEEGNDSGTLFGNYKGKGFYVSEEK
jgi:hypothetical protein